MLSDRLKQLRIEKGKTQKEMAKDLGTTDVSIGRYEKGEREPKTDMLNALANYFEVTTDYLLGRTNEKKPNSKKEINNAKTIAAHRLGDIEQLPDDAIDEINNYIDLMRLKYLKEKK